MVNYGARHQFLRQLHELLRPATYLEIGVQRGYSLAQAIPPTVAVGVDPDPQIVAPIAVEHSIIPMTSDAYFGLNIKQRGPFDLAFIDGMHLVEYALRDFMGVERHARPDGRTVAVFDDVLPYSAAIAGREPLPGDWTGDVWKIDRILDTYRFLDLTRILVDVDPTGVLVVFGLDPADDTLTGVYDEAVIDWARDMDPPTRYISREYAVQPDQAIDLIRTHLENL